MNISVIIPTHNRAFSLVETAHSAMAIDYPKDRYEIIIVDNRSTDDTKKHVEDLRKNNSNNNLNYVIEKELGLHNARHAGAKAAKGNILVFTDDDANFDSRWLTAYETAFESHPEMVAAGGAVRPIWEAPPPKWLLDYMNDTKKFGVLSLMEPYEEFKLDPKCFFFGVNMAIRREVLFKVGGFNPELIGKFTVGDGESGLLRKLQERDWLIGYVPNAVVYHRIPKSRMTVGYLCRWQAHLAGAKLYPKYHDHMPGKLGLIKEWLLMIPYFVIAKARAAICRSKSDPFSIELQIKEAFWRAKLKYVKRLISDISIRKIVTKTDWLEPNSDF